MGRIMADEVLADGGGGPCSAGLCSRSATGAGRALQRHRNTRLRARRSARVDRSSRHGHRSGGARRGRGVERIGHDSVARHRRRLRMHVEAEPRPRPRAVAPGFHKTSVVGPVAAAIASGVVMGLSTDELVCAAGLACSGVGHQGLRRRQQRGNGQAHACRPRSEAGVRMARLAQRGFTGPRAAVDGRYGLLEVFAGDSAEPNRLTQGLGEAWAMDGLWVKVYPICGWIQGVVQLLSAMRGPDACA